MRPRTALTLSLAFGGFGCATKSPLPEGAYIRAPVAAPQLPAPPEPALLPAAPALDPGPDSPLQLGEVLKSVDAAFPLLFAVEQERLIAAGQRLAAEGQFDPTVRASAVDQAGTFSSTRLDAGVQQASPFGGVTTFAGWRHGLGNFPIYYGERKTAEGGEFRAGVNVPLLQNRDIDPRRARLRAAQIAERLADPTIRRARLDAFRAAAQAYWAWQAAGAQYRVAQDLLKLAQQRQDFVDATFRGGLVPESAPVLNRRLAAAREETLLATERTLQQAALRLSLYLRDSAGNPVVPKPEWLLQDFPTFEPTRPDPSQLASDVAAALAQRPELVQFQLEKERRAVELQLATNQLQPILNVYAQGQQDVGISKKTFTGTGPFDTDRTTAEVGAQLEVPLPFRNARGLTATARAQLAQLLARERFARDDVTAQVQDAASELQQAYLRVGKAREELRQAQRVLELDTAAFRGQRISLIDLNIQEIAAAEARVKVVTLLGGYYAAVANYLAALGLDATGPQGGAVLSNPTPAVPGPLPPPRPVPKDMPPPVAPKP